MSVYLRWGRCNWNLLLSLHECMLVCYLKQFFDYFVVFLVVYLFNYSIHSFLLPINLSQRFFLFYFIYYLTNLVV